MKRRWGIGTILFLGALYLLHQDFWNWHSSERVLGLPIGLAYHATYCLVAAAVFAYLTRDMGSDEADEPDHNHPHHSHSRSRESGEAS